ncbi:MAG: hypothetical protein U0Y82_00330 [Thermoleophilia bacterium]
MSRVTPLTGAVRDELPACCRDCVFWQRLRGAVDPPAKRRWVRDTEATFGPWGRAVHLGPGVHGFIQYGPSAAFPRAHLLPCGPPHRQGALITCAHLAGDDRPGTCERLLLEALADLKARDLPCVDVFTVRAPDDMPISERFFPHQTLFDRTFMQRFGFQEVRSSGPVALMRLELAGLIPGRIPARVHRLLERLRTANLATDPGTA